jgi:hypothetical protein
MAVVTRAAWHARPASGVGNQISAHPFGVAVHYSEGNVGTQPHDLCAPRVQAIQQFHMTTRGYADIAYCVDEQTEILTEDGWRSYRELNEGDSVLTLNHETGLSEWQPVIEVCVFPAQMREMVSMESSSHSSLSTPTHRWPVERPHKRTGALRMRGEDGRFVDSGKPGNAYLAAMGQDRRWVTSETFGHWDRVPIAADCADLPNEQKYADALVEVVAWFWTEGHIHKDRAGLPVRSVSLSQSHEVNMGNCSRIRGALTRLFGPAVVKMPRTGASRSDGIPRWREYVDGHKAEFWLNADAGAMVQSHAPQRVPTFGFLRSLTRSQLSLFIEVSMLADSSGVQRLAQKDRAAAEAFQFACTLAGYGTSLRERKPTKNCAAAMWEVNYRKQRHFLPYRLARESRVAYDGEVWCPRTLNQSWLARRNGSVYFTGNTFLACQHGAVYEGRGTGTGSAANGTTKANADYYAVCALIGPADKPTPQLLTGIGEAIAICRKAGAGQRVLGHRDLFATACPGDALYVLVKAGYWDAVTPTAPRPTRPAPAQPTAPRAPLEDTMKPWFARCKDNTIVIVGPTGVRKLTGPQWQTWTNLGYKLEPNMRAMDVGPFNAMIASLGGIIK